MDKYWIKQSEIWKINSKNGLHWVLKRAFIKYKSSYFEIWLVSAIKGVFRLLFVSARIGQNAIATYGCPSRGLFLPSQGEWWGTPLRGKEQPNCSSLGRGRKDKEMNSERKRENLRAERAPVVWTPRVSLDVRKNTRCKLALKFAKVHSHRVHSIYCVSGKHCLY